MSLDVRDDKYENLHKMSDETAEQTLLGREPNIAVIGLGYVGLPLAIFLAKSFSVVGFDIDKERVSQLRKGHDRTHEISGEKLAETSLVITDQKNKMEGCNFFIITVPTPIKRNSQPDLSYLEQACALIGPVMRPPCIVVFECTVYPGVTEKICGPILEEASGLKEGEGFHLGYSPERINPGDSVHTVDKMIKVIAAQQPEVLDVMKTVYGAVTQVFAAKNIMTAEAAKVIENAQRDINVAFINEVSMIMSALGVSMYDVLDAAETKWNFLPFSPGLVGGHCIGVDPYYLAHCAQQVGIDSKIILSGRHINESMGNFFISCIKQKMNLSGRVLVLGLTFKENVPDLRNTKVADMILQLKTLAAQVDVHDPLANEQEAMTLYDIALITDLNTICHTYDTIILAAPHTTYTQLPLSSIEKLLCAKGGGVADIKGIWRAYHWPDHIAYWCP
jgi:UDP-N-acetyl-D-galactosamine dehydrogenase